MSQPPALLARLADRAERAARLERLRACARRWSDLAEPAALVRTLDALDVRDPAIAETVLALARPLLSEIGWIRDGIALLTRELASDPLFEPPLRAVRDPAQQGLVVLDHPLLRVTVLALSADGIAHRKSASLGRRAIGFPGNRVLYRFERAAGLELDLWQADAADACFSAATAGRCRHAGRLVLTEGALLEVDGAREAWTFARVPHDLLLVQGSVRVGAVPLAIEYDAGDGGFLSAQASATDVSRMEMIAAVLGRMGRRDALPVLAALTRDAPFSLRWSAAREMAALDAAAASPILRHMAADDPHPDVRTAARATLPLLAA